MARARAQIAILVAAIASVGVIFVLDTLTGPQIGMSLFYLAPVAVAAWRTPGRAGLIVALIAGSAWLASDLLTQPYGPGPSLWNGFSRLVIFGAIAILVGNVRREERELKASHDALEAERGRLSALVGALRDPILVVAADGHISSANRRASEFFGGRALVGRAVSEIMPFVLMDPAGPNLRWTGVLTDPFGSKVEVEVTRAAMGGAQRDEILYVVYDVSRHAELNRLREQLLYNVAHELRGPLGVLETALDILATEYADLTPEEHGRLTASAGRTAKRLRTLMEDLLSAGSIQSGRFTVTPEGVPLREIVDDAAETVELVVAERDQRLDVDLPLEGLTVHADRRYARQVLTNLLTNASKYGPHGTPITIHAEADGGEVRVSVEDLGPGIPDDQLTGLFERFYRMDRTGAEPGIGLGLAIAKGIVEAHGGRIGIDSQVGRGTKVWFTLPSASRAVAA